MKVLKFGMIALMVILVGMMFGCDNLSDANRTATQIQRKTMNGDNAIANYEYFKQQFEDIQAFREREKRQADDLQKFKSLMGDVQYPKWNSDDKTTYQFKSTVLEGTRSALDRMVAEYNARSKMVNRVLFKDNLPVNIFRGVDASLEFRYNKSLYDQTSN